MAIDKKRVCGKKSYRVQKKLTRHSHGLFAQIVSIAINYSYNVNLIIPGLVTSAWRYWIWILRRWFGRSSGDTAASTATRLPQPFIHCWINIDGRIVWQPCHRRTNQTRQQSRWCDWRNGQWRRSTFGTRHSGPFGPVPEEYRWANGTCVVVRNRKGRMKSATQQNAVPCRVCSAIYIYLNTGWADR